MADVTLQALENVLQELSENLFDFELHKKHIALAQSMAEELQSAMEMMANVFAVGDEIWMPLINAKRNAVDVGTANGLGELLALYERAEADYLSIPILQSHLEFIISQHTAYATGEIKADELGDIFSEAWTRSTLQAIVNKAAGHLTQSKVLWDQYRDWELENLESASGTHKQELVEHVGQLLLNRLAQPHSNSDETSQAYSSFTTKYKAPDQYEGLMVAASKTRARLAKAFDRREPLETDIVQSGYSLDAYARYAIYERRSKFPDLLVMSTVYERAIAEAAKRRYNGEHGAEDALRLFWTGYCDALRINNAGENIELDVLKRAVRSVPGSGEVWARYIRHLERFSEVDSAASYTDQIHDIYNQAMSRNLLQSSVEQIIPVTLARAGFERRRIEAGEADADTFRSLVEVLENGIDIVRKASQAGDARLRLEKFLVDIYRSAEMEDNAISVFQAAAKHYKTSYHAWILYIEALLKKEDFDKARKAFKDLAFKNMDWPEAIWEAWAAFEHMHGSVEEVDDCFDLIEQAHTRVAAKRAKEAEQSYQEMQMATHNQAETAPAINPSVVQPMDVDQPTALDRGTKRPAEEPAPLDGNKKARIEPPVAPLKRDRENSTVFVASLPEEVEEDDLSSLFKTWCGKIREVKITKLPTNSLVATVEFLDRESVPAALTKDKKRIGGQEIAVHLAWQSTLYVTNFPENADDSFIRDLFKKYGTIFDVRWPSKKFKNTRRFCYVQFTTPSSAQSALALHGTELQPDLPLNVYISNPERKKERTDRDANEREVYVAGLAKYTTQADLKQIFATYGTVKDVRMALDKDGNSKGFAFVEYENEREAAAALQANNYELKKRRIAVTLSDARARSKTSGVNQQTGLGHQADVRSRSIRVRNLPVNTQEGLLQQLLEKIAAVKRVEVFAERNEAIVELQNIAEAGKLLLKTEPVVFNDQTLEFVEEGVNTHSVNTGTFIPRTTARPKAGIGHKRKPVAISQQTAPVQTAPESSVPVHGKGQDDFRKMISGS